jgi:hypothetical protein
MALQSAPAPHVAAPRLRWARMPRPASARRSMCRGTAFPALFIGATCPAPTSRNAAVPAPRRPTHRAPAYTPHVAVPLRRTPAMPRPIPRLSYLDTQRSIPHRLAPNYISHCLLSSREHRAAVARHWHSFGEPLLRSTPVSPKHGRGSLHARV